MGQQTTTGLLPQDGGGQKFSGGVNPDDEEILLQVGIGKTTVSGADYGFTAHGVAFRLATTHSAVAVTTSEDVNGESGSASNGVDARGVNRVSFFVTIASAVGTVTLTLYPRHAQAGSNHTAVSIASGLSDGDHFIDAIACEWPWFMIGAVASTSATVTVRPYLHCA